MQPNRPTRSAAGMPLAGGPIAVHWHRPLVAVGIAMIALTIFCVVALAVDHREVTGLDAWAKPLKFSISTAIYAFTLAWLIGQLDRFRRIGWIAGTVTAVALAIEIVIIVGFAAAGETSHFNVSTPLHTAAWGVMAVSIVVAWSMTFVVALALFRTRLGDPARTLAIRAGVVIAIIGMGLAFLMTGPQGDQIENYTGVIGAHTVGAADGGPGLPLLGWSTVGGDLRIPHFIGMHALQALPLLAIGLDALARRVPRLRNTVIRARLVAVAIITYLAVLALITVQALIGESIVRPSAPIVAVGLAIAVAAIISVAALLWKRTSTADVDRSHRTADGPSDPASEGSSDPAPSIRVSDPESIAGRMDG